VKKRQKFTLGGLMDGGEKPIGEKSLSMKF
jgi:hypothetical protein